MKNTSTHPISGALLRKWRKRARYTLQDVLQELQKWDMGVTEQSLVYWEQGKIPKNFKQFPVLVEYYGRDPMEFMSRPHRDAFDNIKADFFELVEDPDLSVMDRNLETVRLFREVMRYENLLLTGNFDDPEDDDLESLRRSKQINLELEALLKLMSE